MPFRQGRLLLLYALALAWGCGSTAPRGITEGTAGWWRDKTAYEVFVRSYADSNGDGTGDLAGLTAHLDYLNDGNPAAGRSLGVDAVWLMPIFPSPSYHGYDTTDYRSINPQYGTLADFDGLIAGAHRRGIRVLLDMVLNHSSDQHPWFVNAGTGTSAQYRDWYSWSPTDLHWQRPWDYQDPWHATGNGYYYGLFCGCMPDLNLGNAAVEQELTASMKYWLSRGADGFRLDAARYYFESPQGEEADQPATHSFLRRLRASLQADYPDALLVAEAWTNTETVATYYGSGDEVQLAFSFDLAGAITSALNDRNAAAVINLLARAERSFPDRGFEAPFLSNHDMQRVQRALSGDAAAMRVAAATLFAMPGTPFVYYGEELGMEGGASTNDTDKRTAFRWTAAAPDYGFGSATPWHAAAEQPGVDVASEQQEPGSLWNLYRKLIALRHAQPALATGDAVRPMVSGGGSGLLVLSRSAGTQRVLFLANFASSASGAFTVALAGTPTELQSQGLAGAPAAAAGQLSFPGLAPLSFAYFLLG